MREVNGIKIFNTFEELRKYRERLLPNFLRVRFGRHFVQKEKKKNIDGNN